jgi:hypothetical protein
MIGVSRSAVEATNRAASTEGNQAMVLAIDSSFVCCLLLDWPMRTLQRRIGSSSISPASFL